MAPTLTELEQRLAGAMTVDRLWAAERLARARARAERSEPNERILAEVAARLDASEAEGRRRGDLRIELTYPEQLPVSARREDILAVIRQHRAFVLTGETGSGKTTQLPKLLLESGYGRRGLVAVTQPRRVAAFAIAARLRAETNAAEGVVAHSVRFDDRAGPDTVVRVMTDGLLLAELAADPLLSRYEAVIVDEAHERSLNIDLCLGLLRRLRERRPELVLAVSSASIEAERFAVYLGGEGQPAPIVAVSGRTFPVEVRWRPPGDDDVGYLGAAVEALRELHASREPGDALCFLPTERDILDAARRLRELDGALVLPLFSRLTPGEQQRIFQPARQRKIVLATNIAETSLTIPGIRFVIDAGLARIKRYHAASRTERLPIEAVSQASCLQRAGRAGRVEAGVCIRLFAEDDFAKREPFATPEILRSNLAGVLLTCLGMGIGEPEAFPWLDEPAAHAWRQARLLLEELGALDERGGLSRLGRAMSAIPADPQVARILLAGVEEGCAHEACTLAAFLSVQDPRVRPLGLEAKADSAHREFAHEAGDLATVLQLWDRWQEAASNSARSRLCERSYLGYRRMREWADVRHQLWGSLRESRAAVRTGLPGSGHEPGKWPLDRVHHAVLAGMLGNVLMWDRDERAYRGAGERLLHVHPGSALRAGKGDDGKRAPPPPPWLVACEVVETSRLFARLCAPIDPEWVVQLAGERVKRRHREPRWQARRRQVVCIETVTWKGLPIREGRLVPYERVDPRDATAVFVRQGLCSDESELERDFAVLRRNQAVWEAAQRIRHRLRDPSLHVDEHALERFYRDRLGLDGPEPPVIASSDGLRRWLREHSEERLALALDDLVGVEARTRAELFPEAVTMGGREFRIDYRFLPGDELDGATLTVGEDDIGAIEPARLDWLVPGWRGEMVEAWLQSLPKEQRRELIPLAETARRIATDLEPESGLRPLAAALADALRARGLRVAGFYYGSLPPHCRLRFRFVERSGAVVYEGRDPAFLAAQAQAAGDRLAPLRTEWETAPSAQWPGDCPGQVSWRGIVGWVALARARDEKGRVAARRAVYASAEAAAAWHDDGLDALLEAACSEDLERIGLASAPAAQAARIEATLNARVGALRRQLAVCALVSAERGRVADAAQWEELLVRARAALTAATPASEALLSRVAQRLEPLGLRLKQGAKSLAAVATMRFAGEGVARLTRAGWPQRLPWNAAARVDVFLAGYERLLDLAAQRPEDARRAADRGEALLGAWDELLGPDSARWAAALGLSRRLRAAAGQLEECILALTTPGAGQGAGWAEGKFRQELAEMGKLIADARGRCARARAELVELRPIALRAPAERRDRLLRELDTAIAALPELGLGCDLVAQLAGAAALAARVRAGTG